MSYAVIKTGGKQYKVKSGEILKIEKLPDGPNFNFQRYTVRVPKSNGLDLTAMEDPGTKKQRKAFESGNL